MPTPTYTPLANVTLGSAAASVTFSSISQSYRDLVLVCVPALVSGTNGMGARFNSDSGSNYSYVFAAGDGSTTWTAAGTQTQIAMTVYADLTTTLGTTISTLNIMDYSATDKHKTVLVRDSKASIGTSMTANRWANTSAITSIVLTPNSGSFATGSSFALYGIAS